MRTPRTRGRAVSLIACALVAGAAAGCAPPALDLFDPNVQAPAAAPTVYNDQAWAGVLRDHVKSGLVDYAQLAAHAEGLQSYLDQVRFVGPKRTPNFFKDADARLAYYLNVYNACVLKAVLSEGIPPSMYDVRRRRLPYDYRFAVDGEIVTLEDIAAMAREASGGDARIEFAMCSAAKGAPPLSNQPFRAYNLRDHLARLAQEAMDDANMVLVDHERQNLAVALAIWSQREAFEAQYCRETASPSATMLNCLMHLASGIRRQYLNRATGYDVRLLPFDRALNAWTPE